MSPVRMAKVESAARVALGFGEAFNRHDVSAMMELMSADCILEHYHPAPDGASYHGKESISRFWEVFFSKSPHARIEIEEVSGLGLRCILRWKYHWVDDESVERVIRGVDIFQVKDGFICEQLSYVKG